MIQPGETARDCVEALGGPFSRAEASVRTTLGEQPIASASAANFGEVRKFKREALATSWLTYEVLLTELSDPPIDLDGVPVTVWVRGEIDSDTTVAGVAVEPIANALAFVGIRSSSRILWNLADVLNESAVRRPASPGQDRPDFDKRVAISLIPGHTYLVDLYANCRLFAGRFEETVASASTCHAEADPVFTLDQAALDRQLGTSSFRLASFYGFQYSAGVSGETSQPVPEPGTAGLLLLALAGLAVRSRRRTGTMSEPARLLSLGVPVWLARPVP